jgi:DNA-binding transcriptional LysR family regulator
MEEPLDSRQLRAFVVLAKTGSYTETARQLFVTYLAISHAMPTQESSVECRLLSNMNKKVILTDAGEALLHHPQQVLKEVTRARSTLDAINK